MKQRDNLETATPPLNRIGQKNVFFICKSLIPNHLAGQRRESSGNQCQSKLNQK